MNNEDPLRPGMPTQDQVEAIRKELAGIKVALQIIAGILLGAVFVGTVIR